MRGGGDDQRSVWGICLGVLINIQPPLTSLDHVDKDTVSKDTVSNSHHLHHDHGRWERVCFPYTMGRDMVFFAGGRLQSMPTYPTRKTDDLTNTAQGFWDGTLWHSKNSRLFTTFRRKSTTWEHNNIGQIFAGVISSLVWCGNLHTATPQSWMPLTLSLG